MKKIAVVTGTRADYGLLYWVLHELKQDAEFHLQLIVTGMHLAPEFGLTVKVIEEDGFAIDEKVEMLLSSDTAVGVAKSLGLAVIGFADALRRLEPDLIITLGDRYEILAAAQAALIAKIPVAHLVGGDITEGAFDDAIRHSITKMSHLHFVTNAVSLKRVRQLGEDPAYIFNVGSPGIDQIKRLKLLERGDLEKEIGFNLKEKNLLITFHPVTLEEGASASQFKELLQALDSFELELGLIFTRPNSDPESRVIIKVIDDYVSRHPNAKAYTSLGQLRYLSLMRQVDAVVGNSSSGLYEAPSFKKPTVNIGDRQKGRLRADSVIDCEPNAKAIEKAIREAFVKDCSATVNPYGDGDSAKKIVAILKQIADYRALLKKHFWDLSI